MTTNEFPTGYLDRTDDDLIAAIQAIKQAQGSDLSILGHHYQLEQIVRLSDFIGDSFKLCRDAAQAEGKYIVFCGVQFMAESARVLARPDQIVQHPEMTAGCPMADMADLKQVETAWDALTSLQKGKKIIPVTYMNSNVDLKAFCGRNGGIVCTSSNASAVFDWAYKRGETILFFPDEHLGVNTAFTRGVTPDKIAVWNPATRAIERQIEDPLFKETNLIVWKGFCHVHTHFSPEDVAKARSQHPKAHIIVHPESPRAVVELCDSSGSTEAIVQKVRSAKPGETVIVGTEINIVSRLAHDHPEVKVLPLSISFCPNMAKITLGHLLWTLENMGEVNVVKVDKSVVSDAQKSLQRMLEL